MSASSMPGPMTVDISMPKSRAGDGVKNAPTTKAEPGAPASATGGVAAASDGIQTVQLPQTMQVDRECLGLYQAIRPFSMVDIWIYQSLHRAMRYVLEAGVAGSIVECGVWRGGCVMFMAMMMKRRGVTDRDIYLYDTFAGMTEPGEEDYHLSSKQPASAEWSKRQTQTHNTWCYAALEEVRRNVSATGYPAERLHFVKGPVEETIPATAPERIALLRLDTDFYQSTMHELVHLYPRVSIGGVLILDDYGTWAGQRKAVEEYFEREGVGMLLQCASTSATGVKGPPRPGPTVD